LGYKEYNIAVMSDVDPPVFSILSPVQGSDIIPSTSNAFIYRISDSSVISRWSVTVSGKQVAGESDINGKQEINGSFQVDLNSNLCPAGCSTGSEAVLVLTAEDLYGNKISSNWRYGLVSDNKPTLSVRLPALGASYYEGEVVPVSLLPSDDIALKEVGYKVVRDGNLLYKEVLAQSVNGKEVSQGEYVNGSYRVISSKQGGVTLNAYAIDSSGQETIVPIIMDVLADNEAPALDITVPDVLQIEGRPGDKIAFKAVAIDNKYIATDIWQRLASVQNLRARVTLPDSDYLHLDWVGLKSSGGVEDVKLPNPGTFGEIVYQERYRRTFDGKFVLNDELASYEGQHLRSEEHTSELQSRENLV